MKSYEIALFILIITAVITGVNDSGLFATHINEPNINQIDEADVQDLTNSTTTSVNPFSALSATTIAAKSLFMGMISVLTIVPFCMSFGIPLYLAVMIQAPIYFVYASDFMGYLTGRSMEA